VNTTKRSVLRHAGSDAERLIPISLRVPQELWDKCGWAAATVGLDRSTFVRNALSYVTRNAKPPANAQSREILASDEEWAAWDELAKTYNTTIDFLARHSLNRYVDVAKRQATTGKGRKG